MANIVRLENWAVRREAGNGYQPPEALPQYLSGNVYGHHRKPDGARVSSSHLVRLNPRERTALTASGTHYQLGKPDPSYVAEMAKLGVVVPGSEEV